MKSTTRERLCGGAILLGFLALWIASEWLPVVLFP